VQRKALAPNNSESLDALTERLLRFGDHHRQIAKPFQQTFTRADLDHLLAKIDRHEPQLTLAA
jgi:hypothetical protein